MSRFSYIAEKLADAPFENEPFRHVHIEGLLEPDDFERIVRSPQIDVPTVGTDEQLIEALYERSFKEIKFPGTTTDIPVYLNWHKDPKKAKSVNIEICEGFGVTMRMQQSAEGTLLAEFDQFFKSDEFWEAAARKFGIDRGKVTSDTGLQKYLDGYEISPHPDIRRKALTFMLNLNPAAHSDRITYHTSYLRLKPERAYVRKSWEDDIVIDRCWVPWNWCDIVKHQTRNNSIVLFSPANDTMHAVKASYDHLTTQRTQYYGNLWYKFSPAKRDGYWRNIKEVRPQTADAVA